MWAATKRGQRHVGMRYARGERRRIIDGKESGNDNFENIGVVGAGRVLETTATLIIRCEGEFPSSIDSMYPDSGSCNCVDAKVKQFSSSQRRFILFGSIVLLLFAPSCAKHVLISRRINASSGTDQRQDSIEASPLMIGSAPNQETPTSSNNERSRGLRRRPADVVIKAYPSAGKRSLIGSSPPKCSNKCGACTPCASVLVPIHTPASAPMEYYPEIWRCECRNKIFNP